MITVRQNVACRLTMKAISKGSLAGCLVQLDAGSTDLLAQQNLQFPEHANNRTLPSWLFDAHSSARNRLTSSRPDAILVTPLPKNPNCQPLLICTRCHNHGNPAEMNAELELNVNMREIHLVEVKI